MLIGSTVLLRTIVQVRNVHGQVLGFISIVLMMVRYDGTKPQICEYLRGKLLRTQ